MATPVIVAITPTYSGCPALDAMRDDLVHALRRAGYGAVEVRTVLSPPWSTDWISAAGRRKLAAAGIAPPGTAPQHRAGGPVPLTLSLPSRARALPALRITGDWPGLVLRCHGLPLGLQLLCLLGAVRAREGDLTPGAYGRHVARVRLP